MFQLIAALLVGICSAARLDNTYLPPGAKGSGGGPGLNPPRGGGGGSGAGGGGGGGFGGNGAKFGGKSLLII